MESLKCPYCNYETPYPEHGRVIECLGECYTTYSLFRDTDDPVRVKMKLVEIFFLDPGGNVHVTPEEIDRRCEFRRVETGEPGTYLLFAREIRVDEDEIEKLKNASLDEIEIGVDTMERLHAALDRFERDLISGETSKDKLLNEIKVVESLVRAIRERIELSI